MFKGLDKKDLRLLHQLDLDCRQSLSQLGKRIGMSKQVVDYRLKNLMKRGVISHFYTVVNFTKLGYSQYKLYLKFQNVDLKKEGEITNYWVRNKNVLWVASCRGQWDAAVSIVAKDLNELGGVLTDFMNNYSQFILEKNVLITQVSPVFTRTYFEEQTDKKEFIYGGKIEQYELNLAERELLRILSIDARIPILDLMEKTGLTRDVINYRLKKLKKDGIVAQFRTLVNLEKTGCQMYKIILRLKSLSSQKENELKQFMKQHHNGTQMLKLLGSWDVELEFEIESEEKLHEILLDIRNQFSDIIRDYDTLLVRTEHKLNYFPF